MRWRQNLLQIQLAILKQQLNTCLARNFMLGTADWEPRRRRRRDRDETPRSTGGRVLGEGVPLPRRPGSLGSVVRSPAPAENEFWCIWSI